MLFIWFICKIILFFIAVFSPFLLMHLYCYIIPVLEGKIRKKHNEKEKQDSE